MKLAYADRAEYLGDPDFVTVPLKGLTSKRYAEALAAGIDPYQARAGKDIRPGKPQPYESDQTTHYSVVDKAGNAVAVTYTLNTNFGSGIVAKGTGILLNNEMDDFSAKPGVANAYGLVGGDANAVAAGKRPLSSMTPTMVLKDGKPVLVTGSPGGARIITTVLQTVVNTIDFGMNPAEAAATPRFHHQWTPDELRVEKGISPDTVALLKSRGHNVAVKASMGRTQTIQLRDGMLYGASDPRNPDGQTLGAAQGRPLTHRFVSCAASGRDLLAHFEVGLDLQRTHHAGVIPARATVGHAAVEQLLRLCRVGQGHAELPRAAQGQVQVLLVQRDAEARVERALDHALGMHFQDLGRRKAAQQRLAHAGRIGAGARCEQQRLGHGLDVQRHDDLVGHLGGLAVAVAAHQGDVLAHALEQGLDAGEHVLGTADHDGQRGVLGAHLAAGDRRIQVLGAHGLDAAREVLGGHGRDGAHVHHHLAAAALEACGHAVLAEQHLLDIGVRQHQEDDVGTLGHAARRGALGGAALGDLRGDLAQGVHEQLVAGREQVARHGRAHDAEAHETKLERGCIHAVYSLSFLGSSGKSEKAHPALVADAVQVREQEGVVDLARAGFVAARVVRQLHVADARQLLLQRGRQFALGALGVVDVVLHEGVGRAHLVEDGQGLVRAVQVEAGNVEGVDGFDQQAQVGGAQRGGGKAQVLDEGAAQRGGIDAGRRLAGQAVELGHAQGLGIGHGLGHTSAELVDAVRVAGDAALARIPVAGGQVVQHDLQAMGADALLDLLVRMGVGEQELHGLEAGAGGALEAVEERHLGEQHAEVGSETGHVRRLR
ncbi:hypothetical protein FQR65_LT20119 [Abscondita terminalis]|nr:hypothetical protein FQR65_LT20119 [Abscondita terminalis]